MSAYADASFLVSAFGRDANTPRAVRWMRNCTSYPILISRLTLFEAENAFRAAVRDSRMDNDEIRAAMQRIHRALKEGLLVRREIPAHQWFPQAHRLSAHDKHQSAAGALDILHVAAALVLRVSDFLSFDDRQRELARAEGLETLP